MAQCSRRLHCHCLSFQPSKHPVRNKLVLHVEYHLLRYPVLQEPFSTFTMQETLGRRDGLRDVSIQVRKKNVRFPVLLPMYCCSLGVQEKLMGRGSCLLSLWPEVLKASTRRLDLWCLPKEVSTKPALHPRHHHKPSQAHPLPLNVTFTFEH